MTVHDPRDGGVAPPHVSEPRAPEQGPRLGGLSARTGLLTPEGYRPIEQLRRGDLVATMLGRGPMFAPIAWIGRRGAHHPRAMVRVRRDAVGDGMPLRDVILAADHALYIDGVLYPAAQLVNGATLLWDIPEPGPSIWALRLERHDIVCADGLAVETLLHDTARAAYAEVKAPRLRVVAGAVSADMTRQEDHG